MITAYTIIMTFVTIITFLLFFLLRVLSKKNKEISKKRIAYIPLAMAIIGILQLLIYGEGKFNSIFIYLAVVLVSIYILRSDSKKIRR